MHELGLIIDVVEMTEDYAVENGIEKIRGIVLTVGEGFSVIPQMMQSVYRNASKGTLLEDSFLKLDIVEASARCDGCQGIFNPLRTDGVCPHCSGTDYEVLTGKEFEITSIVTDGEEK